MHSLGFNAGKRSMPVGLGPQRKRPSAMPLKNAQYHGIDPKRKVIYRNFHDISGVIYLVEISSNTKKVFVILFPNFEKPDMMIKEIMSEKIFQKLLMDKSHMYD